MLNVLVCPQLSSSADKVLFRSLEVLATFEDKWPTVSGWIEVLRKVAERPASRQTQPLSEVSSQEALLNTTVSRHTAQDETNLIHVMQASIGHSPQAIRSPQAPRLHEGNGGFGCGEPNVRANSHQEPNSRPGYPSQNGVSTTSYQYGSSHTHNLHVLSAAAAQDAYVNTRNGEPEYPNPVSHVGMDSLADNTLRQTIAEELLTPDATNILFLDDPFDNELVDFVQGYVHLDWAGGMG